MKTDRKFRKFSKTPFFASFALTCVLAAGNAGAGIPVTDVGNGAAHWTNSISTWTTKFDIINERVAEVKREMERVKNLTTQASSLISGLTSVTMQDPKKRPLDHGIKRCDPDFTGFSLSDVFTLLVPSLSSSVPEQQRAICKQIVRIKNQRHNEGVDLLDKLKARVGEMDKASDNFRSAGTTGEQMSNLGEQGQILNKIMTDIQYSQAIVKIYENTITSMEDDQKYLAEEALSGKKKSLGESLMATGAQTVALCGGLIAAKSAGSDFSCSL